MFQSKTKSKFFSIESDPSICADGGFDSLADCVDFIVENRLFTYDFGTNTVKDDTRPSLPLELQPPPIRGEIR